MFEQFYMNEDAQSDLDIQQRAVDIYDAISSGLDDPYTLKPSITFVGAPTVADVRVKYPIPSFPVYTHSDPSKYKALYSPSTNSISVYVPDTLNTIGKDKETAKKSVRGIISNTNDFIRSWIKTKDAKQLIVHELIHSMDFGRYVDPVSVMARRKEDAKLPPAEKLQRYYNSPEEFNAFFNQFLTKLQNDLPKEQLIDYNNPQDVLRDYAKNILPKFNPVYRKKFINRFYKFWDFVLSNKIDFLH